MTAPRAIVFDLDGLLIDSEPLSGNVWESLLQEFGFSMKPSVYRKMIGRRPADSARIVLEAYPLPFTLEELVETKAARWEAVWRQGIPALPGAHELLAAVSGRNLPWAVATSSPRHYAEAMLEYLDPSGARGPIVGGNEVAKGKPAPDIYLAAARRLGISPQACLALEDSVPGAQAARSAGMTVIAVPNQAEAAEFGFADYVFSSLHEVRRQLPAILE